MHGHWEQFKGFVQDLAPYIAVVGLLATGAMIFGDKLVPNEEDPGQRHPTAVELAEESDEPVSVSEFPSTNQGADGSRRFCIEIGGQPHMALVVDAGSVACRVSDEIIVLPPGDSFSENDEPLYEACEAVGGHVEGVAVDVDDPFSIPACVAPLG